MDTFPESHPPDERLLQKATESIKRLYAQIQKMPELTVQAKVVDQILLSRMEELKNTATSVIDQFQEQKKVILQRFDKMIMPIAKEVLDRFLLDAQKLKENLDDKLSHLDQTTPEEWNDQAARWTQLLARWNDRQGIVRKILEVVEDRTNSLIDKDIQIIQEYQSQSLAQVSPESNVQEHIEKRLHDATAEPLAKLKALKTAQLDRDSLQQATEWMAKVQEKRASYFDQSLMKIDHVIKDTVKTEVKIDWSSFLEMEGEIIFMERELHHIHIDLSQISSKDESDRQFIAARLEGLLDHASELEQQTLPLALKQRIEALKSTITTSLKIF